MTGVFLDTGFLIALEASDDQHHDKAISYWVEFSKNPAPLVTSSYVLDETVTFFNTRNRHAKAVEIGNYLLTSTAIQFIQVDHTLFLDGWAFFQRFEDKRFSLTDCISFSIMQKLGIKAALAFDKHFIQAGYSIVP
ncbi:MAG: PIN domain-containing protein [Gammaproteobacteria bacterium]|nr:PIN domain-containing protein [Gammaproteobacteria bacterium]